MAGGCVFVGVVLIVVFEVWDRVSDPVERPERPQDFPG